MALLTSGQTGAIVWAQWRALSNHYFRSSRRGSFWLTSLVLLVWYGSWAFGAAVLAAMASDPDELPRLTRSLPGGLFLMFGYWQIVPILLVSSGVSLDLARLLVYPIPHGRLFAIEVLLRLSTALEMAILAAGLLAGLTRNPALPWWVPLPLLLFLGFNLLLSAGLRDLLTRLMERKYLREAVVLGLVLLAGLPQWVLRSGVSGQSGSIVAGGFGWFWPWSLTAALNTGEASPGTIALLGAWTAGAWLFGRHQFERSLRFDAAAARAAGRKPPSRAGLSLGRALRFPSVIFPDPVAALIEKELRILIRSPRFRLLFLMGFSFGLLIWLPMADGSDSTTTLISAYSLLLLGDVCFWNSFGMDRAAVATWFTAPVRITTVIAARNLAMSVFILLEVALVCLACSLFGMPVSARSVAETYSVMAVLSLYLFAVGNVISVRYPRSADPGQSWRNASAGRTQLLLLFVYPLVGSPILLAYAARYAFDSGAAFYAVLLADLLAGAVIYSVTLESSAAWAAAHSEHIVQALSTSEGPVSG